MSDGADSERRASKNILNLPFYCQQSYKDRLIQLNLLSLTYWHEYLYTVFFFKAVIGRVEINPAVIPQIRAATRTTRYTTVKRNPFKGRLLTELVEYGMLLPQTLD